MQPRYLVTILFLALFGLVGLGVYRFSSSREGTNTFITYGSRPTGCVNTTSVTKKLAAPITVEGVVVKALVFTPCVDPAFQAKADFGLIDTWEHLGIDVLSQIHDADRTKSPNEQSLTTSLAIKLVAAKTANDQITQYDQYKGKISIAVGTVPHTDDNLITIKTKE